MKLAADFDLAVHGSTLGVQKLEATVSAAEPVLSLRALQVFEFNPKSGELRAVDTSRELFAVALQGVPIAWAKPFLPDITLTGGRVRGEFAGTPRGGGVTLRSTAPLTVDDASLAHAGKPLLEHVSLSLSTSADYTPQGWQAEIGGLTAKSGETALLSLEVKAGQLAGKGQPLKATGKLKAQIPA